MAIWALMADYGSGVSALGVLKVKNLRQLKKCKAIGVSIGFTLWSAIMFHYWWCCVDCGVWKSPKNSALPCILIRVFP